MVLVGKMQTPADASGNRDDVYFQNSTDEVMLSSTVKGLPPAAGAGAMDTASDLFNALVDTVGENTHTVVNSTGAKPNHACFWFDCRARGNITQAADTTGDGKCFTNIETTA